MDDRSSDTTRALTPLRFEVLGAVRAWRGTEEVQLGTPQGRAVLSALLLRGGSQVSVGELAELVWDSEIPNSAEQTIRTYIHRLRRVLGTREGSTEPLIATVANGYLMRPTPEELDAAAFREHLDRADLARRRNDPAGAAEQLRQGLALWRGTALSGVPGPYAQTQRTRLEDLRLRAVHTVLSTEIEFGPLGEATAELLSLVGERPLDERFRELLMLTLYRSGRQTEALAQYHQARKALADELGVDPGPALQELHARILRADPTLSPTRGTTEAAEAAGTTETAPAPRADSGPEPQADPPTPAPVADPAPETPRPAAVPVPAQLPAALPGFTGREHERALADALLADHDGDGSEPGGTSVALVIGTAGVGKTTFAVQWAHRLIPLFPDGQLYVNLRGFDPNGPALSPTDVIRSLLAALGIPPQGLPSELDALAAEYRTAIARRRILLVLDNARDSLQVRPLLPGSAESMVIVTSRDALAGLRALDGARHVLLDVLSPEEAARFLANRIGARRAEAEPEAVSTITALCAQLPLALAVVAARATARPAQPLAQIAVELQEDNGGLDAFGDSDATLDIRAVLSWSYRALSPATARLFRVLALHPGSTQSLAAAASLAGLPAPHTRRLLSELNAVHLLGEPVPDHYASHDLLRAYAGELALTTDTEEERDAVLDRLVEHYLHSAYAAALLANPYRAAITMNPVPPGVLVTRLTTRKQAVTWFAAELGTLLLVLGHAEATGRHDYHVVRLGWCLQTFLFRDGQWQLWLSTQQRALRAAERLGDTELLAEANTSVGSAYQQLGDFDSALHHLREAANLCNALGMAVKEANIEISLGNLRDHQQRSDEAAAHYLRAIDLFRECGEKVGEAITLNNLGHLYARTGNAQQAVELCVRALEILATTDDRHGQASTWDTLGSAHLQLGTSQAAVECFRTSIELFRELDDQFNVALTLTNLVEALNATGDQVSAQLARKEALGIVEVLTHSGVDEIRSRLDSLVDRGAATPEK